MIDIYAVRIPQHIESQLFMQLLRIVSEEKRHKIEKYKRIYDQYRYFNWRPANKIYNL